MRKSIVEHNASDYVQIKKLLYYFLNQNISHHLLLLYLFEFSSTQARLIAVEPTGKLITDSSILPAIADRCNIIYSLPEEGAYEQISTTKVSEVIIIYLGIYF